MSGLFLNVLPIDEILLGDFYSGTGRYNYKTTYSVCGESLMIVHRQSGGIILISNTFKQDR